MSLVGFLSLTDGKSCSVVILLAYLLTGLNNRLVAYFSSATGVCVGRCSENICFLRAVSAILLYKEFAYKDGPKGQKDPKHENILSIVRPFFFFS